MKKEEAYDIWLQWAMKEFEGNELKANVGANAAIWAAEQGADSQTAVEAARDAVKAFSAAVPELSDSQEDENTKKYIPIEELRREIDEGPELRQKVDNEWQAIQEQMKPTTPQEENPWKPRKVEEEIDFSDKEKELKNSTPTLVLGIVGLLLFIVPVFAILVSVVGFLRYRQSIHNVKSRVAFVFLIVALVMNILVTGGFIYLLANGESISSLVKLI
jgi:hypothetical protein